jgi:uncharacterized protein
MAGISDRRSGMFDWDEANVAHIAKHGVTLEEAEEAIMIAPIDLESQYYEGEERFLLVGITSAARVLVVAITWRGDRVRVVTAYPAPAGLRQRYWAER